LNKDNIYSVLVQQSRLSGGHLAVDFDISRKSYREQQVSGKKVLLFCKIPTNNSIQSDTFFQKPCRTSGSRTRSNKRRSAFNQVKQRTNKWPNNL